MKKATTLLNKTEIGNQSRQLALASDKLAGTGHRAQDLRLERLNHQLTSNRQLKNSYIVTYNSAIHSEIAQASSTSTRDIRKKDSTQNSKQ